MYVCMAQLVLLIVHVHLFSPSVESQIELRALSYVPEEWPDHGTEEECFAILSEEESNYFKNMIFGAGGKYTDCQNKPRLH